MSGLQAGNNLLNSPALQKFTKAISCRPMKTEYRGYKIDVTAAKHEDGVWTAKVYIGPVIENPKAFREMGEIDGAYSQSDAEAAGVQWGKYRIDLYLLSTL